MVSDEAVKPELTLLGTIPEIRNQIMRYVLVEEGGVTIEWGCCDNCPTKSLPGWKLPPILLTCKQTLADGLLVYYAENDFTVEDGVFNSTCAPDLSYVIQRWLAPLRPEIRNAITSIEVWNNRSCRNKWNALRDLEDLKMAVKEDSGIVIPNKVLTVSFHTECVFEGKFCICTHEEKGRKMSLQELYDFVEAESDERLQDT